MSGDGLQAGEKPKGCRLSIDTVGTGGPTQIAGAISAGDTKERAQAIGLNIAEHLRQRHSTGALTRLGDAIVKGHTGTNVMNLRVIVIGKEMEVRTIA